MTISFNAHKILFLNTLAFTICFACWTINGVLVTFLVDNGIFHWNVVQVGWLLGIPILTGSLFRLTLGIWTDKWGGKYVFTGLLFFCAVAMFLLSQVNSFYGFVVVSFLFGMVGTSFAVGIAYTSVWYPKNWQGRALGIFGVGNAGSAVTTLFAPTILKSLSQNDPINGWRMLPVYYGIALLVMGILFLIFADNKKPVKTGSAYNEYTGPMKSMRVWRFGLYYFVVFGLFVAFSQWLLPYYVNVYQTSLVLGGLLASAFSLPGGVLRAVGGFLSDKFGARKVMYWVFIATTVCSFLLIIPKMDIFTAGRGVQAAQKGTVTMVSPNMITVDSAKTYAIKQKEDKQMSTGIFPSENFWQEVVVQQGQSVKKKELLAAGITQIHFEANMWVYTFLVLVIGVAWAIGKAAVYKFIPDYFPNQVGAVGGFVGLLGGVGGFIGPIIFGYLLVMTELWTSCWILVFVLSLISLAWLHHTVMRMQKEKNTM